MGDNPESALRDIENSLNYGFPIVVVKGSSMADQVAEMIEQRKTTDQTKASY